jgi:tRNA A-37 threonylcarbamoyl transferase component Bud32
VSLARGQTTQNRTATCEAQYPEARYSGLGTVEHNPRDSLLSIFAAIGQSRIVPIPMPLSVGDRLGPYEIVAPIGAGGMGEVYRARDTRLNRIVAIKVSKTEFSERFEREARAIASLNHPNICTLHDVGPNYLVMELVEGPTLADHIMRGAIPLDETLRIARQIGEAFEAAHAMNIVHRDLKPGNIKIKPDGTVKVLDFGLAKIGGTTAAPSEDSHTLSMGATQPGAILGTAAYMSPEQARGRIVDKRADIWAFGVVMYEMLTGRRLFKGEDLSETLASVFKDEPRWNDVPLKVRRLLKKCLEKDPKRRLSEIADAWALLDDEPSAWSRFGILGWGMAGVLAIALAVALWALWRVPPPPDRPLTRLLVDLGTDGAFSDTLTPLTISPDGRRLVLAQGGRLRMRQLDQAQSTAVPGTEGAGDAFFSPDGLWIGFAKGAKLWKVSLEGGAPEELCDAPNLRGASWGRDGNIVAALDRVGGLSRVSENGGKPEPVTHIDQSDISSHRFPQVLPDGSAVLFTAGTGTNPNGDLILVHSLKTGREKILSLLAGRVSGFRLSKHSLCRSNEPGQARINGPATTGTRKRCRLSLRRQRVVRLHTIRHIGFRAQPGRGVEAIHRPADVRREERDADFIAITRTGALR